MPHLRVTWTTTTIQQFTTDRWFDSHDDTDGLIDTWAPAVEGGAAQVDMTQRRTLISTREITTPSGVVARTFTPPRISKWFHLPDCPDCPATKGEPCINLWGLRRRQPQRRPLMKPHPARLRLYADTRDREE